MVDYVKVLAHFKRDIVFSLQPEQSWETKDAFIDEQIEEMRGFSQGESELLNDISKVANDVYKCTGTYDKIQNQWLKEMEEVFGI